ncbi:hypothetical protein BC830DRAFT_1169374 [Chytriomyces sp. MP71]|nr:hypothetical protein BC830DRAFT_1169374 [Chytriomyces sp. MP71]
MTGIMPGALVTFSSSAFTTTRAAVQSNVMAGGTSTLGGGEANAPLLSYRNVNVASAVEAGPSNASILSENDEVDSNQTLQQGKKWCEYQYWSANGNGEPPVLDDGEEFTDPNENAATKAGAVDELVRGGTVVREGPEEGRVVLDSVRQSSACR